MLIWHRGPPLATMPAGVIGVPFRDPAETKIFSGGMLRAKRGLHSHLGDRPHTKAGGSNDQRCAQAWDVGNISDGAEHRALTQPRLCGWRWWWWWRRWRRGSFFCLPGPFPASAVGLPEAVGHQSHPQAQEDQAVQSRRHHIWSRLPRSLCDDLRPQRLCRRDRAVEGARPRRSPERGQSDRLFLSQTRRLQALTSLVRARAESRSEPCADLAVLRPVADRARQPRSGAISSEPHRGDLRDRLRGVSVTGGCARKTTRHRSGLLSLAASWPN